MDPKERTQDETKDKKATSVVELLSDELQKYVQEVNNEPISPKNLKDLVQQLYSQDTKDIIKSIVIFRKALSIEQNPPIQQVISMNVVPRFIQLAASKDIAPYIQWQALWCLTNICSGTLEQITYCLQLGALQVAAQCLQSQHFDVFEQAIWIIGNVSGENAELCAAIIKLGVHRVIIEAVTKQVEMNQPISEHTLWAMANLVRSKKLSYFKEVKPFVAIFAVAIKSSYMSKSGITDALWGLSYLSDGEDEQVEAVLKTDIIDQLSEFLACEEISHVLASLRVVGNICSGLEEHSAAIIKHSTCLENIIKLLSHEKKPLRKEAMWIISNITAENGLSIDKVIGNDETLDTILKIAREDEVEVAKEAFYTIANAADSGNPAQRIKLVNKGIFETLAVGLNRDDPKVIAVALEGIFKFLESGQNGPAQEENQKVNNQFFTQFESSGCLSLVEELQEHPNDQVYELTTQILELLELDIVDEDAEVEDQQED